MFLPTFGVHAQEFADKSFYLIDSLVLDDLASSDRTLVDSALTLYNKAEHDTDRLNALGILCENMMHESWHEYQFLQYEMIKGLIDAGPSFGSAQDEPTTLEKKYLLFLASALNNIGYIYMNQGDIPKALEYYHKSLRIREEIGWKEGIANSLNNIGGIYMGQGELATALNYGSRGLQIAREIGSPHLISVNSGLLSKVARKQGNFKEALEMYELHIQMRDSIKNEETQKAAIRQQTKYEFEKAQLIKEQEENEKRRILNEKLKRRDNLQYSVVLICLLVIGVLVAMLGRLSLPERVAEGIIFFSFLILFEFLLVLADPYIENWSGGAPGFKLLFNAAIAALIFPLHSLFETKLKGRLVKS